MSDRLVPDRARPGAFTVVMDGADQSWVDPADPLRLEFEYVQRIAELLEACVLSRADSERVRVVHVGGGGLTLPRYVEARRPHTAQIVLEPDSDLVDEVRRTLPLPAHTGIKIRETDGRTGLADMPVGYAHAVIIDAFAGLRVPGELVTHQAFEEFGRVLRPDGVVAVNLTDQPGLAWTRRAVAGLRAVFAHAVVSADAAVWKGRRFGNLVAVGSQATLPVAALEEAAHRAAFPWQTRHGRELDRWVGRAEPFTDEEPQSSPPPAGGRGWFS